MRTNLLTTFPWMLAAAVIAAGCNKPEPSAPPPPPAEVFVPAAPESPALPEGHPDISAMRDQTLPAGAMATADNPQWVVPDGWTAGPSSSIRRGSFTVAGPAGQSADIAVTAFPGDVGGMLANINRWRDQIDLAPIDEEQAAKLTTPLEFKGGSATVVDFTGEEPPAGKQQPQRVIVATIPHGGNSWFFKMTGDAPVVEKERARFLEFVQSVRFE